MNIVYALYALTFVSENLKENKNNVGKNKNSYYFLFSLSDLDFVVCTNF